MPHSVTCIIAVIITVVIMRNKRVTGNKEMAYQSEGVMVCIQKILVGMIQHSTSSMYIIYVTYVTIYLLQFSFYTGLNTLSL